MVRAHLKLLRRERADAIVLDLMMPNHRWAFLRQSRQAVHSRVGIVAVSAVIDQRVAERLRALGGALTAWQSHSTLTICSRAWARPEEFIEMAAPSANPGASMAATFSNWSDSYLVTRSVTAGAKPSLFASSGLIAEQPADAGMDSCGHPYNQPPR